MDVFEFIDKHIPRKQIPYIRLVTIYTKDGAVSSVCLTRFNDKKIAKKAAKVGLDYDKMVSEEGLGTKLKNPQPYDIQNGEYYLNYYFGSRELDIYRQ